MGAGDAVQSIESLPSMHTPWVWAPAPHKPQHSGQSEASLEYLRPCLRKGVWTVYTIVKYLEIPGHVQELYWEKLVKQPQMVMMTTLPGATWTDPIPFKEHAFCRCWRSPLRSQNTHNLTGQLALLCWLWRLEHVFESAGFAKDSPSFVCVNWYLTG